MHLVLVQASVHADHGLPAAYKSSVHDNLHHCRRRSLGAEVNWGIRFRNQLDADVFLTELAGEVQSQLLCVVQPAPGP